MKNSNLKEVIIRLIYTRYSMEKNLILKKNFEKIKKRIYENDQEKIDEIKKNL